MGLVRGLLDRIVLVAGFIAGGCLPGFVAQYRQRVGGRLDQARLDLAPFQEIAQRFHGGDLDALVRHHLASPDPSFLAEGQAIQGMIDAIARLTAMVEGLAGPAWKQLLYLARHYDRDIGAATWTDYVPGFAFDPGSLLIAGAVGIAAWLLFLGAWKLLAWLAGLAGLGYSRPTTRPREHRA